MYTWKEFRCSVQTFYTTLRHSGAKRAKKRAITARTALISRKTPKNLQTYGRVLSKMRAGSPLGWGVVVGRLCGGFGRAVGYWWGDYFSTTCRGSGGIEPASARHRATIQREQVEQVPRVRAPWGEIISHVELRPVTLQRRGVRVLPFCLSHAHCGSSLLA